MNLSLAIKEMFEGNEVDVYRNENNDVFMTREQIGQALEYKNPRRAIKDIHLRNSNRLDRFSRRAQIETPSGRQETTIYNEKGIYEIIRHSKQPKADNFYDWVYELLSKLRKGEIQAFQPQSERDKLEIERMKAESRLLNARTRQAKLILDMQKNKELSPVAIELLQVNGLETLTGESTGYRPRTEKTYSATEVGRQLGITANMVGRIATAHDLKTSEYGIEVLDKSPYSDKQVPSFRYYQHAINKIKELI